MKRWITGLSLLATCAGAPGAKGADDNADVAGSLAQGEHIVSRLDADVNGDGVPDAILVAVGDTSDQDHFSVKVLAQLPGRARDGARRKGAFEEIGATRIRMSPPNYVVPQPKDDPPTVAVEKGVLIIRYDENVLPRSSYGLGNPDARFHYAKTATTYRYRYDPQGNRMRLIGLDVDDSNTDRVATLNWNLLTGARAIRYGRQRYGRELKATDNPAPIYMDETPDPGDVLEAALKFQPRKNR